MVVVADMLCEILLLGVTVMGITVVEPLASVSVTDDSVKLLLADELDVDADPEADPETKVEVEDDVLEVAGDDDCAFASIMDKEITSEEGRTSIFVEEGKDAGIVL
ncbi:hypothetical protein EW146_g891 [Bondarzewia mesenterica]|uniref:Uncharacterized protein n=1 Tax=Bondarzewia mesenterica TaxID=1095465 RepID=A0A4S4MBT1_9AGAM|nr:hypothetical protein EW146_g891 [Bondarzewia mesenterica]